MFHSGVGGIHGRLEHRPAGDLIGRRSRDSSAGAEGRMIGGHPSHDGHVGAHRRMKRRGHPVMVGEGVGGDREHKVRQRRSGPISGQAVRRRRRGGSGGGMRGAGGDGGLPGGDEAPGGIDLEEEDGEEDG